MNRKIVMGKIYYILSSFQSAMVEYNRNQTLKHMINKIRKDPVMFDRYVHHIL